MDGTGGRRQQGEGTGRGKGTCTGTGRGRSTSSSSSQRSLNQKKDQAVLGFPCKKPVRISKSLIKQIDGRSEKATGRTPSLLLGAPTPEKKCSENSSSRVKNRGVAMSVKEVANQSRKLLQSSNDSTARPKRNLRQKSISAPPKAPKTTDFSLPDKYEMLAELFDSMESAIKLLRLRKRNSSFCNICPQVESMTHKRFMYNHVAQMKHILPEGLLLEKIMTHDEETLCMKPELKITVLHDAVLSGKSKVSKANNTLGLRKAFRTRLMEFVKAHPNGDDVPEAILPEPFNRKCQLTSPGCSLLPPVICKSPSPARGVSSDPPAPHQEDPQPSMMSSLLPKNFQRRFSQRNFTAEPSANPPFPVPEQVPDLKPLSEVPETAKPDGFGGVLPSSLHSHLSPGFKSHFAVNLCPTANTQDIKESNEIKSKSSTSNKSHLESPISESCCSSEMRHFQQTPSKVPNPDPVADSTIDVGTPCKTTSESENPNSPISKGYFSPVTPRVTRRSVALKTASDVSRTPCKTASESENPNTPISKGYFSPVTPRVTRRSVALKTVSDVSSAVKTPIVKSILKTNIKSPISKKSLRFAGVSAAPITSPPVLSPGTPGFASPEASRLSQPTVKRSNNTNVKRAIAFNRSEKDSSAPLACEQPGTRSTPLKRKAEEANLDDDLTQGFQSPQSLVLSTPAKSGEWGNSVDSFKSSPLRRAANPFAISKKNEKVMQNSTYPQHDRKTFSLENTPVKGFPNTPPLHASKRFRFGVDESQTPQVDTTKNCSETSLLCLRSPKKSNAEPCKLDIGRESNVSEPAEKTSNNIQEACKIHIDGMSQSDQEIIDSIIMPVLQEGYGLTESNGTVSSTITDEENRHYGTAGLLAAHVEAKVVDTATGKAMPPNHKGELWLRGPTIMKGYFGNVEATELTLDSEGWLKTGDLCYIDEEGFLFVVDRIKELIKYKAFQVAPAELEELLLSNPDITDAAVIPYPDHEAGQIPMAFVVKKSNSNFCEEDVINFVAKQVSPYKKIRRVAFVNSIPKSPTGKILRKDLIHQALSTSRSDSHSQTIHVCEAVIC